MDTIGHENRIPNGCRGNNTCLRQVEGVVWPGVLQMGQCEPGSLVEARIRQLGDVIWATTGIANHGSLGGIC